MIITPMKCKLCGKVISPPDEALVIGETEQVRNQKIIARLVKHLQSKAEEELKTTAKNGLNSETGRWHSPDTDRPHAKALIDATVAAQNFNGALMIGHFEISADMEADRQRVLKWVHEITQMEPEPTPETERKTLPI